MSIWCQLYAMYYLLQLSARHLRDQVQKVLYFYCGAMNILSNCRWCYSQKSNSLKNAAGEFDLKLA